MEIPELSTSPPPKAVQPRSAGPPGATRRHGLHRQGLLQKKWVNTQHQADEVTGHNGRRCSGAPSMGVDTANSDTGLRGSRAVSGWIVTSCSTVLCRCSQLRTTRIPITELLIDSEESHSACTSTARPRKSELSAPGRLAPSSSPTSALHGGAAGADVTPGTLWPLGKACATWEDVSERGGNRMER